MDMLDYSPFASDRNHHLPVPIDMVTEPVTKTLSIGQRTLLSMLPEQGDIILLDDAVAVVGMTEERAYTQIVVLMNRGALVAELADLRTVDPEIVLRRL